MGLATHVNRQLPGLAMAENGQNMVASAYCEEDKMFALGIQK